MTKKQHERCNRIARLCYKSQGYIVAEDFDFSQSHHPQEVSAWNQALIAHDVLMGTNLVYTNWVDPREQLRKRFK